MSRIRERGFTAVEALIALLVVALIVAAGWFVFNRMQDKDAKTTNTTSQTADSTDTSTPEVNKTSDLDAASETLDNTNVDASTADESALDSELSAF
jgi:type II secretory pathway pseudopilin PulG